MQIDANGIALEVIDHPAKSGKSANLADAPTLILIRGLGTQLIYWPTQLIDGFVDAGFRVITFDNRDIGASARCPAPGVSGDAGEISRAVADGTPLKTAYSLADMANDVVGLMDAMNIGRAHILGISMGGAIAQILAIEHADRLLSATIVMTAGRPLLERDVVAQMMPKLLAHPETLDQAQDNWVAGHAMYGSPGYPMPEADIRAEAAAAHKRGTDPASDAAGINRQLLATMHAPDRRPDLANVTLPCLVLHGVDDTLIPVALGAEIAAHIPTSEYHAIDGMGHIITPLLAPVINDLVVEFIARRA